MTWLIIDGYNIINSWPEFTSLRRESMELARVELLETMKEFTPLVWEKIVIVFDAYRTSDKATLQEESRGLEVVYTAAGQTADAYIERLVAIMAGAGEDIEVASSDYLEQRLVFWKGGLRISAQELRQRLQGIRVSLRRGGHLELPRRDMLDERLSEHLKKTLENWRRG